jgi:type II secretory pathway component PulF
MVSVPAVIISGSGVLAATLILVLVVPACETYYRDCEVMLGRPTMLVLDLSRAMRGWYWVVLWAFPLMLGLVVPRLSRRHALGEDSPRVRKLVRWKVVLAALFVSLVVANCLMAVLVLPYVRVLLDIMK